MHKLQELFVQYNRFVVPQEFENLAAEAHKTLSVELTKNQKSLVLQIIDSKDSNMNYYAEESFKCGFYVAYKLLSELNIYQENRLEAELFQPGDFLYANEEK